MGAFGMSTGSYGGTGKGLPNPKPNNYTILNAITVSGRYLILKIKYHDCINYEGIKVLVYECTYDDIKKQKLIDPHFCDDNNYISPIARFEPTEKGWDNAHLFVHHL